MWLVRVNNRNPGSPLVSLYKFKPTLFGSHLQLLSLFPLAGNGRRVLDVGCASGYIARLLAAQGYDVVGIDRPGPVPADFTQNVRLVQADLDAGMPSLPEAFDFIVCADVIEHLQDPLQFLLDLHPRLAPGGRLVASLPNSGNLYFRLNVLMGRFPAHDRGLFDRTHLHFYTWEGWQGLFARAGFRIERSTPTGVPVGLVLPKWSDTLAVRILERCAHELARAWKTLFAYQFIVVAHPEVRQ